MLRISNFGEHLRKIRGKVPQKEFAKSIGMSQNSLSYLESGKREPSIGLLFILAEKKGIDVAYWFSDEDTGQKVPENGANLLVSNLKDVSHRSGSFDSLKFSEIHSILSQLYVYLDTRDTQLLPAEKRMLSDILAACQRLMDSDGLPSGGQALKII